MDTTGLPHEIETIKKLVSAHTVKETHISYALINDSHVYKTKKTVDFGFLNYTLAKSRRAYCILEKELNERFSKGIYLEVLKLVRKGGSDFALVPVESSLTAIEYVLKMKRIEEKDFLANRISANSITSADMERIGKETALLFKNLEPAPKDENFANHATAVKFNAVENFNQTEKYAGTFIDKSSYTFIESRTLNFLTEHEALINRRAETLFVKNGHGDLRLEHIYFNEDGTIGLIDCIEFNKRFRYIDVAAEAAFLSMEMDMAGMIDFSDSFIKGFISVFNDTDTLKLLNYYRCYLAYVRAKVTCFMLEGKDTSWEFYEQKQSEVQRLINMSLYYALNMDAPLNSVFYGLMGTGKSKNARAFAEKFPAAYFSSDEVRKKAAGVELTDKVYETWFGGIYSKEASNELYSKLGKLTVEKNALGRGCIIDASFTAQDFTDSFLKQLAIKPKFYRFTAPDDVVLERLKSRLTKDSVADGRPAIMEQQKKTAVMPKADLTIETTGSVEYNINAIVVNLTA